MNGRIEKPPDEGKTNEILHQHAESSYDKNEIKLEPVVKLEPEDTDDMVTVSASECATSVSIFNLICGEQMGDAYDFKIVCELDENKSELKKEKIDKEAEKCATDCSRNKAIGTPSPNDSKNNRSKKKRSKPKRGLVGSKKVKKPVATARNKPKAGIRSNKKKLTTSKEKDKQHKCSSCDYTTSQKGHLNYHIRKHTGEKPFPCIHCAKRFKRRSSLQSHMRLHVSEFLFSCSNCLKGFTQSDEKSEHEISCKIRRYECHLCKEYSTFQKTQLEYHMCMQHTGERPFGCDQCSKKFIQRIDLKRHMKTHLNLRPMKPKCCVCYKKFSQQIEKDKHESKCKRSGYECYLCKEITSNFLSNLKQHMRIHTGVRPFQCEMCQKSFTQNNNLQRHVFRCGIRK